MIPNINTISEYDIDKHFIQPVMMTRTQQANLTDIFRIPFGIEMTLHDIIEMYPEICIEMNGSDESSTLSFYYEKNPTNGHYEFCDDQAELDIADILRLDLNIYREGESKDDKNTRISSESINKSVEDLLRLIGISDEVINDEIINDEAVDEIKTLTKKERKVLKKERRAETLQKRDKLTTNL